MSEISTDIIKEAVYELCYKANTYLDNKIYSLILNKYKNCKNKKTLNILKSILLNAKYAYEKKRPLCQDTGQVITFLEIGQNILLKGEYIENVINEAVEKCYNDNYFRKSVVRNSIFDRTNTKTNTPVIIYSKIIPEDEVRIKVLIKGAGSENKSRLEMLLPTTSEEEFIIKCADMVLAAGENACPPMFIGIGCGYTADMAAVMSKEALTKNSFTPQETILASRIKDYINSKAPDKYKDCFVLDVKLLSAPSHIACMPAALTINCHSDRISECIIKDNNITYNHEVPDFEQINETFNPLPQLTADSKPTSCCSPHLKGIKTNDIRQLRELKPNEEILLTGEIFVARDMAHKRIFELIKEQKELPFDIKDKIIFYAGPCPNKPGEISGSIGPTTAGRMDRYAAKLYELGLFATIGKGSRNEEVTKVIKKSRARYFSAQGGIAALLAEKIKKSEIIAFEDLGAEAIYKIYVEKFPVTVEI